MRIAYWIPKATNTHSGYVIFTALRLEKWLLESASVLRFTYIACIAYNFSYYYHKPFLPVMYRKMHRNNYVQNYMYICSLFITCTEFHFAQMFTRFSRSYPHYI